MKLMSFALTERPFLDGTKDVTRRLGWPNAKAGDRVCGVRKGMGFRPGEVPERWRVVEFVNVRLEPLSMVDDREAAREGFPHLTGAQFVEFFIAEQTTRRKPITPETIITRLEFVHLWTPEGLTVAEYVTMLDAEAAEMRRRNKLKQ